jgi:DNA helicase-2/ATP-dependent DNA helicase PcrA
LPLPAFDALGGLNDEQREAALATEGYLLVLAGPGSGKTRTITHRIAHLIRDLGVEPHRILAVTFTNKAAGEMRERVHKLLSTGGARLSTSPVVSTFHSFCARVLRRYAGELAAGGLDRNFSIYDAEDTQKLIKVIVEELGLDKTIHAPRSLAASISRAKNEGRFAAEFAALAAADEGAQAVARVYTAYEARLLRHNALDFDDLLLRCVQLLRERPAVAHRISSHLRYIHVDEFQDSNALQLTLVQQLSAVHKNVCAVGDEDQGIYSFRNAVVGHILEFDRHFPGARVVRLGRNYRSAPEIVEAADALIRHNKGRLGKRLWTTNPRCQSVLYFEAADGYEEADFVADRIAVRLEFFDDDLPAVAILYRTNAQSRALEEALRRREIPHQIYGGMSFYSRREIRDTISYVKLALNPEDRSAFERAVSSPARGIGSKTLEKLYRHADARGAGLWATLAREAECLDTAQPSAAGLAAAARVRLAAFYALVARAQAAGARGEVSRMIGAIIAESGYADALRREGSEESEGRLENLGELITAAAEYDGREDAVRAFVDHAALFSASDGEQGDEGAPVVMMTMHAAKGLEFPCVFVVGLEQGLMPHSRSLGVGGADEYEEERRLLYVAMTRARQELTLTHARERYAFGNSKECEPSAFLDEIPARLLLPVGYRGGGATRTRFVPDYADED